MSLKTKLSSLFSFDELKATIHRFPISCFCTVYLFLLGFIGIYDLIDIPTDLAADLIVLGIGGFFLSGAMHLVGESQKYATTKTLSIVFAALALFALLVFTTDKGQEARYFTLVGSMIALVTAAPFILKPKDDLSFWCFSRQVGFGASISFIAALILFAGASGALASIGYLFEVKIEHEIYETLWLFGAALVAPLYALTFVPRQFETVEKDCDLPPQVGFISNWILAPLVAVYLAILYAYFIKIGITGDVPKNQLANMIAGFAAAGIATYSLAWPFVNSGKANKLLTNLMKRLFPLLVLPILVMIYAIGVRIAEYGVTEKRYIVVVVALWFAFLVAGFVLKKLQLKHITLSFAVLLFLGSWGPWSMVPISQSSQFNRLEGVLTKLEILQEGEIVKTDETLSFDDRKNISSKLTYLQNTKYYDDIVDWFDEEQIASLENKSTYPANLTSLMGFDFVHRYETARNNERFNLNSERTGRNLLEVTGYDYVSTNLYVYARDDHRTGDSIKGDGANIPEIKWYLDRKGVLMVSVAGRGEIMFDLEKLVREKRSQNTQPLVLEQFGRGLKIRLVFSRISGKIEGEAYQVENASFTMLVDL